MFRVNRHVEFVAEKRRSMAVEKMSGKAGCIAGLCRRPTPGRQAAAGIKLTMGDPPRGTLASTADRLR